VLRRMRLVFERAYMCAFEEEIVEETRNIMP